MSRTHQSSRKGKSGDVIEMGSLPKPDAMLATLIENDWEHGIDAVDISRAMVPDIQEVLEVDA